jgi:hypothetical protein
MHDESTFSGTTQAVCARAWLAPLGVAVLLALLLAMPRSPGGTSGCGAEDKGQRVQGIRHQPR